MKLFGSSLFGQAVTAAGVGAALLFSVFVFAPLLMTYILTRGSGAIILGFGLVALIWVWALDAGDANRPYFPDELRNGRVVPARPGGSQ